MQYVQAIRMLAIHFSTNFALKKLARNGVPRYIDKHINEEEEIGMYAVEFQARLQNGMIPVPQQYQAQLSAQVRVIILTEPLYPHPDKYDDIIARLLKAPRQVNNFKPMTREEIYERR
jgi:hypothetical protein